MQHIFLTQQQDLISSHLILWLCGWIIWSCFYSLIMSFWKKEAYRLVAQHLSCVWPRAPKRKEEEKLISQNHWGSVFPSTYFNMDIFTVSLNFLHLRRSWILSWHLGLPVVYLLMMRVLWTSLYCLYSLLSWSLSKPSERMASIFCVRGRSSY
jgi:hypothetical protein